MIDKFALSIFVEDNWDIVRLLNEKQKKPFTVLWISNLLDQFIPYKYKYYSLTDAVDYVKNLLKK